MEKNWETCKEDLKDDPSKIVVSHEDKAFLRKMVVKNMCLNEDKAILK